MLQQQEKLVKHIKSKDIFNIKVYVDKIAINKNQQ